MTDVTSGEPDHRDRRTGGRRPHAVRARRRPHAGGHRDRAGARAVEGRRAPDPGVVAQPVLRRARRGDPALLARVRHPSSSGSAIWRASTSARWPPPSWRWLSRETQETATLSVLAGDGRIYVDQVTPPREIVMSVPLGQRFPLHAGLLEQGAARLPAAQRGRGLPARPAAPVHRDHPHRPRRAARRPRADPRARVRDERRRAAGRCCLGGRPGARPQRATGRQHQRVRARRAPRRRARPRRLAPARRHGPHLHPARPPRQGRRLTRSTARRPTNEGRPAIYCSDERTRVPSRTCERKDAPWPATTCW